MPIKFQPLKSALLTGLCYGTFCVSAFVLQTTVCNPAVGQDALNALQELDKPAETAKPTAQEKLAQNQQAKALFNELDKLIPGEQTEGTPAAESLYTAVDSLMQRKPDMALGILKQTVVRNPEFPPAELLMAGLFFAAKDQKSGFKYLQDAAIENPDHPAIYAAYGRLAAGSNRIVDSKVHFEKLLSLLDNVKDEAAIKHYENEYLEGMSQTALQLKQYDLTRNLAGRLLERKPDSTKPLQLVARVAFDEGKLDEAVANLAKIREVKPESRVPEAVIATWLAMADKKVEADKWIDKLPAAYPNDATVQIEYAAWVLSHENVPEAAAALARAEAIGPLTPTAKNIKGKIAFYQRRFDDAVAIYKELYEANPRNQEVANMYVLSLAETSSAENKALANELANKNAQLNSNNRITMATLGYVRLPVLGANAQQKNIFASVAKTRDGRSPEVDYFLASFLKEAGDSKSALLVLKQATKYPGLFLYRNQADQMMQALSASVGSTGALPTP